MTFIGTQDIGNKVIYRYSTMNHTNFVIGILIGKQTTNIAVYAIDDLRCKRYPREWLVDVYCNHLCTAIHDNIVLAAVESKGFARGSI
jgi:hypothetical protein